MGSVLEMNSIEQSRGVFAMMRGNERIRKHQSKASGAKHLLGYDVFYGLWASLGFPRNPMGVPRRSQARAQESEGCPRGVPGRARVVPGGPRGLR